MISGAAYGIDAAAHHGAAVAGGATVAALDGAADHTYPRGHEDLLANVAAQGAVVRRIPARPAPATAPVPGPQPPHRRPDRGHRSRRGRAAQRRTEHRAARPRARPPGDGRTRAGDLQHVRWMSSADPRRPGHVHHLRRRGHRGRFPGHRPTFRLTHRSGSADRWAYRPRMQHARKALMVPGRALLIPRAWAGHWVVRLDCCCSLIPVRSACAAGSVPATGLSLRSPLGGHRSFPNRGRTTGGRLRRRRAACGKHLGQPGTARCAAPFPRVAATRPPGRAPQSPGRHQRGRSSRHHQEEP